MRAIVLLCLGASLVAAQNNPYTTPADLELGGKLYRGRCGHCHGQAGEGGRGAALTGAMRHGSSDREVFQVIRRGIPNTEMPGAFNLPEHEVWRMVSFLRTLRSSGSSEKAPGDALAGGGIYEKNGCANCHMVNGHGGDLGPDLTHVGGKRAIRHLRESIVNPNADLPLDYRTVTVVPQAGSTITGIHLNEDEYSVHLRDLNGNIRSFLKKEVKEVRIPRTSVMPAYASLPAADLENLVAYMSSLRPGAPVVWRFDRVDTIGGHRTSVLGQPKLTDSPIGKVVEFDGVDDALFIPNHPLAGAETFTFEAIFRPDGGPVEQRWFHLSEIDPKTGADTDNRMLFELRVAGDQWFLDSYNQSGTEGKALMNRQALHPLGAWYHVASVYDGKEFRNYVNGVREGAAQIRLTPHAAGHASVGVRINKLFYFKGAVHSARFTTQALPVSEFMRIPAKP